LAADLRSAADELRELPAVVPSDALAMFGQGGDASETPAAAEPAPADATR
jgi:hypothetical protein